MRKIILTADDFGKSPARNKAIIDSFKQGYITSAGMIVTGVHLQDAVNRMNEEQIGWDKVHLHLNFTTNIPEEEPNDTALTEELRNDPLFSINGKFRNHWKKLPLLLRHIGKWRIILHEIEAQYARFIEATDGKGNTEHLDFHMWYNLTVPTAIALNLFTLRHKIKTVRYWGMHHQDIAKFKMLRLLSWNPKVKYIPATNIPYFLSIQNKMKDYPIIELYTHPRYIDSKLLDASFPYRKIKRDVSTMEENIATVRETIEFEPISWHQYDR